MARKALSKSTRFEVFKRDHFTCQYCGAQPPNVVLVIDHIHPVALGGGNELDNLTTACEPCNAGKSDKLLSKVPIRPDADLMYLEVQQEAAEIRRFREAKEELAVELNEFYGLLADVWLDHAGTDWAPSNKVLATLVKRHGHEIAHEAVTITAQRFFQRKVNKYGWDSYMFGVAKRLEEGT